MSAMGGKRTQPELASPRINGWVFKHRLTLFVAVAIAPTDASARPPSLRVSLKEAKSLAYEALTARQKGLPKIGLDVDPSNRAAR